MVKYGDVTFQKDSRGHNGIVNTYMDNVGDGLLPLSTRIPRRLSVEVELLAVEGLP